MADKSIVGSLFSGLTPEMYQQAQAAQAQKQAMDFAQLTPQQQSQFAMYSAGQNIPKVVAGIMGVEDPQLQAVRGAQQILNKYDTSTSKGLKEAFDEFRNLANTTGNSNYMAMANQIAQQYSKVRAEEATYIQKTHENIKQVGLTTGGQQVYQAGNEQYILGPGGTKIPYYGKIEQKTSQTINVGLNTVDKESNNRKDFVAETKPYRDVYTTAGKIDSLLNQGPLGEIIAKKQFSKLAGDNNISNRDVADLSNFGDLGQRLAGALSRFANGEYSEAQLQEAKNLVKQLKKESEGSYNEIKGQYRNRLSGEKLPEKTINFIAPDLPSSKLSLQLPPGANYKEGSIVSIKGHEGKKFVIRGGKAEEQ